MWILQLSCCVSNDSRYHSLAPAAGIGELLLVMCSCAVVLASLHELWPSHLWLDIRRRVCAQRCHAQNSLTSLRRSELLEPEVLCHLIVYHQDVSKRAESNKLHNQVHLLQELECILRFCRQVSHRFDL